MLQTRHKQTVNCNKEKSRSAAGSCRSSNTYRWKESEAFYLLSVLRFRTFMFNLTGTWRDVFIDKLRRIPQSLTCDDVIFEPS